MADTIGTQKKGLGALFQERILWLAKPLGGVMLVLWIMSPETTARTDLQSTTLLGFLLGAIYGIFFYHETLRGLLFTERENVRKVKNRLPDEFYWGKKLDTLFSKE